MSDPVPPFDVRAIAAYQARNTTEVSLEVGKIYHVTQTDGKGLWWQTRSDISGNIGWFPASYTEVIQSQAPPPQQYHAPAPAPVQTQPAYSQPAVQAQTHTPQPAASQPVASQPAQSQDHGQVPAPSRQPQKEKGDSPVFVKLQVIEARGLRGEAAKTSPGAFIFRRDVMEVLGVQLFQTQQVKKSITPRWNELFQINVRDAESEVLCVRFCNGKKFEPKGKKFLGEINFALRSAVRDFESPNPKFKWYPITGGKSAPPGEKCTGECLIYIEFIDTRERHGPKDFKHESHVGWTKEGGFDINNIPAEWKKIFKQVGIRRADLENNPELATQVLDIMQKADITAPAGAAMPAPAPPPQPQPQSYHNQYQAPAPPPQPQPVVSAPAPPPPPPTPGAMGGGGGAPAPRPPAPQPSAPAPPPPPPPAVEQHGGAGLSSGGGMSDLEKQLQERANKLRKVETAPDAPKPAAPADSGNALSNALLSALKQHRKDIEGDDNGTFDDDDDWD